MTAGLVFELKPGEGIPPIRLGIPRDELISVIGEPPQDDTPKVLYYFQARLQINLNELCRVCYVELDMRPGETAVYFRGVDLVSTPADSVVDLFAQHYRGEESNGGHSYDFPEVDVRLWRPMLPTDYDESDPEDNYRKGRYWLTVGVGDGKR